MNSFLTSIVLISIMVLALVFMGWFLFGLLGERQRSVADRKSALGKIQRRGMP
ncbi:MAG TPA: hypothetical protein VLT85_02170 [Terriglobales bacterium]|nr:hypothetical protein [Terriglobales bacterium]